MYLWGELGPVNFLAAQNPLFKHAFFQGVLKEVGDKLEMLAGFIGDAALGMASVVTGETITAATAGEWMKESLQFVKFAETQLKQASPVTIDQDHAQAGRRSQQVGQRLQMEMPIHEQLRAAELRGQVILAPKALRGAGEDRLGMHTVAAQILREAYDALDICAGRLAPVFFPAFVLTSALEALAFQLAQRFPCQVFGQDRFFLVRLVAWRGRLKVKAEG